VLVSHRFSTVLMADAIAVLDKGRLVEHGPHRQLMADDGLYAELFQLHTGLQVALGRAAGAPPGPGGPPARTRQFRQGRGHGAMLVSRP
jgi:hypothetical protein